MKSIAFGLSFLVAVVLLASAPLPVGAADELAVPGYPVAVDVPHAHELPDPTLDFRNRLTTQLTTLEYQGTVSAEWTNLLRASYQTDQFESGANVISAYDTTRRQLTAQTTWTPSAQHQWVAAIDLLTESINSSDYGAPERDNEPAPPRVKELS